MQRQGPGRLLVAKVSQTHKVAVERIAQTDGEPVAAVVRRLIREEAQRRGLWDTVRQGDEAQRLRAWHESHGLDCAEVQHA